MFRLRTTAAVSLLVLVGATGASLWMSAWPRMQDRATEAAVAARQHAASTESPPPARQSHRVRHTTSHAAIKPARAAPPSPPAPVYAPSPSYPMEALSQGRGGVVMLRVSVDGSGNVTAVDVADSSGDPALDASASRSMRQWRFHAPANGQPMSFDYPVRFRISE